MNKRLIVPKKSPGHLSNNPIKCCNCHNYYNFKDNIFLNNKLKILLCPYCKSMHKINFTLTNDKIINLTKIDNIILSDYFYMGSVAIDRLDEFGYDFTIVGKDGPSEETGRITTIEIWSKANMTSVKVAIFYQIEGNYLSTRSWCYIGAIAKGSKQTFTEDFYGNPISLDVLEGDYLGMYYDGGAMEVTASGFSGMWYKLEDKIPCVNTSFFWANNYAISLRGIGVTPPLFKDSAMTGIYNFKTSK